MTGVLRIHNIALVVILVCSQGGRNSGDSGFNPIAMCARIPSFLRKNTNLRCLRERKLMEVIYNGSIYATKECEHQFRFRPWNCSSHPDSLLLIAAKSFPETSFLFAIHSAGLAYSFAHTCAHGLERNCRCRKRRRDGKRRMKSRDDSNIIIEDSPCINQNLRFGIRKSRDVLRNTKESDLRWLVDEHNKEAGRLALVSKEIKKNRICRCHGVSGACSYTKCVQRLPTFRQIGDVLMKKYKSAAKVGPDNYGKRLLPSYATMKPPTKYDLLYTDESPQFCKPGDGSLGTAARHCKKDDPGPGGCDVLCCNRGYKTIVELVTELCYCRFQYCCTVTCMKCTRNVTRHICN